MRNVNLDELKKIELDILIYVDDFCRHNEIKYSFTGGTLLGAIRHQGFIPWDDDIDLMMDRNNYELFLNKFNEFARNSDYELITYKNSKNYNYLFAKVVNKRTVVFEKHNKRVENLGVFIDIFPIDYVDDDYDLAVKKLKAIETKKYLTVASNWKHFYINKNHGFLRQIPRFVFFLLSRVLNVKKALKKMEEKFNHNLKSNYSACICGSYSIQKELMESSNFEKYIDVEFEGMKFCAIEKYKSYLESIYGDYMKLPPEEQRVARHTFDAYVKD